MSELASWLEAAGTLSAVVTAVMLWRLDRRNERQKEDRRAREHLQRIVTAVRVEVAHAVEAADRVQYACERTISQARDAQIRGATITDSLTSRPGDLALTDAIIYRAIADELGSLPEEVVRRIVSFYTYTIQVSRIAEMGTPLQAYETIVDMAPRVRMNGLLLIRALRVFENSGFDASADFLVSREEMRKLAEQARYDLEARLKERGLEL